MSTNNNNNWVHYSKEELKLKSVKELKEILDQHKINYIDIHEKEELIDLILNEGDKKKIGIGHSYEADYAQQIYSK